MKQKNKILLKLSFLSGIIPLIGGWLIFFTWFGARHFNATDLDALEIIGFFWMLICFWVALTGILLLIIYTITNRKNLELNMFYTILIILVNIPSVFVILPWQGDLDQKTFVKITNQSGYNNSRIILQKNSKTWDLGFVDDNNSIVINYDSDFWNNYTDIYQPNDSIKLLFKTEEFTDTIAFPSLYTGECKQLVIDENLKLK